MTQVRPGGLQAEARRRLAAVQARVMANRQAAAAVAGGAVLAVLIVAGARRSKRR